jgi:protein TonB
VNERYSLREIAAAADVPVELVSHLVDSEHVLVVDGCVRQRDAVALVRRLRAVPGGGSLLAPLAPPPRRRGLPLAASGTLHAAVIVVIVLASSLGLLNATDTETHVPPTVTPPTLVYLITPGPGGGGGGGGLAVPAPPPRAERKAPVPIRTSSPVPRPRPYRPPPRPVAQPVVTPSPTPPPVQAPVVPEPGDAREVAGTIEARPLPTPPSPGPGTGGGVGHGQGSGIGEGAGNGIGPGSGGGTGGGPFRPGTGIEPPQLLREVRPTYTDEARRRAIEGDVVLEIVVRRDGSVGDVRVVRTLGSGLDQRAVSAVRQWRFAPARRLGTPVDVVVDVAVGFSLR